MLPDEDDLESGAVAYSPSASGTLEGVGQIAVQACFDGEDEANRVVEILEANSDERIAILVRARSHLSEIVSTLRRKNIAFQAVEIDQLGERPAVQDLMALTFALLHAADRVSWLAILRAPWCGLTLRDLEALAGGDRDATLWELLHRESYVLSEDGAARVQRILAVLDRALAEVGRQPLRNWVEDAWLRLGGPACVDGNALEDAAAYFDLLETLEEGGDLADFAWFREQVNGLFGKPDATAGQRLQLLTIHKAKGLEFDTVILPGLESSTRKEDSRLLMWVEERGELLLAPISESGRDGDPIYKYLERLERRKTEHETARLLYVAATRARGRLHLLGSVKTKDDGSLAEPVSGSFLRLLWPAISENFASIQRPSMDITAKPAKTILRAVAGWQVPIPDRAILARRPIMEKLEVPRVAFEWVDDRLRHTGTALHAVMLRIAREGLPTWDEQTVRSRRSLYQALLANLGLAPAEIPDAAKRVEKGLLQTLTDGRGRWILEAHSEAASEFPIAGLIDGKFCECVIDRTFVDEQGVRWIIDYKTSDHQGGALENFLESETERYREQLERYAHLMFQKEDRPIRLGLYFPLLGAWCEWAAPVVRRKQAAQATLFEL